MSLRSIFLLLVVCFGVNPAWAGFETPTLRLRKFEDLKFPPQLTRKEIQWYIQTSATALYGTSFVDLGNISDFMHMHLLFRPLDRATFPQSSSLSATADWEKLELYAALMHTQEYSHLRGPEGFSFKGEKLDPYLRNWILWLTSTVEPRGTLVRAHEYSERFQPGDKLPYTVYASDLNAELFHPQSDKWEYSIYFFRVGCEVKTDLSQGQLEKSNLVEVNVGGEKACLIIMDFYCRNHSAKVACGEAAPIEPYYKN